MRRTLPLSEQLEEFYMHAERFVDRLPWRVQLALFILTLPATATFSLVVFCVLCNEHNYDQQTGRRLRPSDRMSRRRRHGVSKIDAFSLV